MNIIDILILLVLVFSTVGGMYKGFFHSLFTSLGLLGAWIGAALVRVKLAGVALSNTTLMAVLSQYLEPESFFTTAAQGNSAVSRLLAGGEEAIRGAVSQISQKLPFIAAPFEHNLRTQAFDKLNLTTLAQYLDQTLWEGAFNLLAFVAALLVFYIVIKLIVNLLDSVLRFPVLRVLDWLPGGILGLIKGVVVCVLLLSIAPELVRMIKPELAATLFEQSTLYESVMGLDILRLSDKILGLLG